ncbi:MAG TPA: enoyl-CoA hydratase-related protein [Myxococcota bacterium]|jgi:enoyl-CoA hydratase/carnithine racemase
MPGPSVRSQQADGVATLTIDREAKRNALDRETLGALEAALDAAARDPEVRVIVLRGAGDRVFCAGADLAEIQGHESIEASRHHFDGVARVILAIQRAGQPVIARVPGFALAGGFGLAVAADFTVASVGARFGLPEIGVGLLPLMVSAPIYRALGSRKALLDLVLTGRQIDAAEAKQLGLVSRVVEAGELDAEIARLSATLLAFSPSALRLGKEAVYTLCEMEYQTSMRYLREMIVLTSRTEDAQEGIRAFFEKRKPVWTGR